MVSKIKKKIVKMFPTRGEAYTHTISTTTTTNNNYIYTDNIYGTKT